MEGTRFLKRRSLRWIEMQRIVSRTLQDEPAHVSRSEEVRLALHVIGGIPAFDCRHRTREDPSFEIHSSKLQQ